MSYAQSRRRGHRPAGRQAARRLHEAAGPCPRGHPLDGPAQAGRWPLAAGRPRRTASTGYRAPCRPGTGGSWSPTSTSAPARWCPHRSAAALHAFPDSRQEPPELTVPRGGTRSDRWRLHETDVDGRDRTRLQGLPATTETRTVLDLAGVFDKAALGRLVDGLLADGKVQLGPLTARALAHRKRGRSGSGHRRTWSKRSGLATCRLPASSRHSCLPCSPPAACPSRSASTHCPR